MTVTSGPACLTGLGSIACDFQDADFPTFTRWFSGLVPVTCCGCADCCVQARLGCNFDGTIGLTLKLHSALGGGGACDANDCGGTTTCNATLSCTPTSGNCTVAVTIPASAPGACSGANVFGCITGLTVTLAVSE